MGTLSASSWLENSVLDQIYAWEGYMLCPSEEAVSIKFNPDKELRLKSNGDFLDHWLGHAETVDAPVDDPSGTVVVVGHALPGRDLARIHLK